MSATARLHAAPRTGLPGRRWVERFGTFLDMLSAARRASAVYEAHECLSDEELARLGLRRADLPSVAARELGIG